MQHTVKIKEVIYCPVSQGSIKAVSSGIKMPLMPFNEGRYSRSCWLWMSEIYPDKPMFILVRQKFMKSLDVVVREMIREEFGEYEVFENGCVDVPTKPEICYPFQLIMDQDWQVGHFMMVMDALQNKELIVPYLSHDPFNPDEFKPVLRNLFGQG